jgi:DnaJ-class molecular chaperone
MRNPYEVLGVAKDATAAQIRTAYRKLAKQNHPDLNPGDRAAESRFKEASSANDLLSDPDKRARFDRGEIDASGAEQASSRGYYRDYGDRQAGAKYGADHFDFDVDDLSSMFSGAFRGGRGGGGGGRAGVRIRGADQNFRLELDFLDAVRGSQQRLVFPAGALDVHVPAGTTDGTILRLRGKGQPGDGGGEPGDALIEIHVRPSRVFRQDGNDLHIDLPVGLKIAVPGGKVQSPTIDGPVNLTVPAGSNDGSILRLRGKGLPNRDGTRGDQYVTLRIEIEDPKDPELREFLDGWRNTAAADGEATTGSGT